MIRIAFIKFGGLAAGGTEKVLQTIALNLPKDKYQVTYFYTESAPYVGSDFKHMGTDPVVKALLEKNNINLIKVNVTAKDITVPTHDWVDSNFFDVFNEKDFDLIQTGRSGQPEYPFYKIKTTPIVDSIHIIGGVDNQFNIARVMHISEWSARKWIRMGGDPSRSRVIYYPVKIPSYAHIDYRKELALQDKFIFGFHQRNDPHIFSPTPLEAYSRIETDRTHFLLLTGSQRHKDQAKRLGIKNITFLPHTSNLDGLYSFLETLDVYTHGRRDGELNSQAIAEAMSFGVPIVSHLSLINNGHVETIGDAGVVTATTRDYVYWLRRIMSDPDIRERFSENAKLRFRNNYDLDTQMKKIEALYEDVLRNPFPDTLQRKKLDAQNNHQRKSIFKRAYLYGCRYVELAELFLKAHLR